MNKKTEKRNCQPTDRLIDGPVHPTASGGSVSLPHGAENRYRRPSPIRTQAWTQSGLTVVQQNSWPNRPPPLSFHFQPSNNPITLLPANLGFVSIRRSLPPLAGFDRPPSPARRCLPPLPPEAQSFYQPQPPSTSSRSTASNPKVRAPNQTEMHPQPYQSAKICAKT
jgi:hypothetical protein